VPESFDSHLLGVALAVEEDEAPDPVRVRLLGAQAQVSEAGGATDAFEESGLLHGDKRAGQKSVESSGWAGALYTRRGRGGGEKIRLSTRHYRVRPNRSAFYSLLSS
jgi:hypothetical protein